MATELTVLGLGTPGGEPCADGADLPAGVHLLWTLDPGLGFPVRGYAVERRDHQPPEWLCLPFDQAGLPGPGATSWAWLDFTLTVTPGALRLDPAACAPDVGLSLPDTRTLTVHHPGPTVAVRVSGRGGPPTVELLAGVAGSQDVVARARPRLSAGSWTCEVWAPVVQDVRITGDDLLICSFCIGQPVPQSGWRPLTLTPILVPLVPPGTENLPGLVQDLRTTRAAARRRLPATLADADADRLADGFVAGPGEAVELLLREGADATVPATSDSSPGRAAPTLRLGVTTLLGLAALDPDLSRMLGLTWLDPVTAGRWDYRVTAHHGAVPFPATTFTFDDLPPGLRPPGTLREGPLTVAAPAGLEVLTPTDTSTHRVLRIQSPPIGLPAALLLPPQTRSVRLHLAADSPSDPVVFSGRRGDRLATTASTGTDPVVVLEDEIGLDAVTWDSGTVDLVQVDLGDTPGRVGDLVGHAWNLTPLDPPPVHPLTVVDLAADADTPAPTPDGRLPHCAGVIGLDWEPAQDLRDAGTPVRVQIGLSPRGSGATPASHGPFTLLNSDRPDPATTGGPASATTWPGPDVPQRWTTSIADPGWYALRIRPIDAFGRLGAWTPERTVDVRTAPVPGTPDGVTARYLDPADPTLSDADRALANGAAGIEVTWTWPAGRRLQAPGVETSGEFRIYLRHGDPDVLTGSVLSVGRETGHSRLQTDLAWPGAENALAGQFLRVGGASYPVRAHGRGPGTWFDVGHLSAPLRRPGPGACNLTIGAGGPRVDFDRPADFERRLSFVPAASPLVLTTTVMTVTETADGAELTLANPLPTGEPAGAPAQTVPGLLLSQGVGYPASGQSPGSTRLRIGAARGPDGSVLLPAAGDACTVWSGTRYRQWLPGVRLLPAADEPFAVGFVGVSAADGDPAVSDDPRWDLPGRGKLGRRPGRESPTGAARLAVPHRAEPPTPSVPRPTGPDGDVRAVEAEPADWYGRARYDLPLTALTGVAGYRVLRVAAASLFGYDQQLRRTGRAPYAGGPFPADPASAAWLSQHHPDLTQADLVADPATLPTERADEVAAAWREWSAWFYPGLSNRKVLELADLDTHQEPFAPAHSGTVAPPGFRDSLDGRGLGRFLYRVRSVDASGAAGPWSATFPPVVVRDVTPPKTPTVLSASGDENAVVIVWRCGGEPDLAGYRIWRDADASVLADVRRVPVHADLTLAQARSGMDSVASPDDPHGLACAWTDVGLAPGPTWHYRVAAVDTTGNVSRPTPVLRARPIDSSPPEPPVWTRAERVPVSGGGGSTVELAWSVDEDGVTCLVERLRDRDRCFAGSGPWLTPDAGGRDFTWRDDDPGSGAVTYRIRARDVTGNEQRHRWNPVTVPGPGGTP
jgi:hypothetical protein